MKLGQNFAVFHLFLRLYSDGFGGALFGTGTAGYAFEWAQGTFKMHHGFCGAGSHTHQAADAKLLIEHDHTQAIDCERLCGASLHAGLALVAHIHINGILAVVDPYARFGGVVFLEIQAGTHTLA